MSKPLYVQTTKAAFGTSLPTAPSGFTKLDTVETLSGKDFLVVSPTDTAFNSYVSFIPESDQITVGSGQPARVEFSVESETRGNGNVRVVFRTKLLQDREPLASESGCCCGTKVKGDESVDVHTVITIPAVIADSMRRKTQGFDRLLAIALKLHHTRFGYLVRNGNATDPLPVMAAEVFSRITGLTPYVDTSAYIGYSPAPFNGTAS